MSRDPFDLLRDQLVAAAAAPEGVRRRGRGRGRGARPLAIAAAALALGGSATAAAVLTFGGEPSPPLKGRVDGDPARRYSIVLRPDLRAGAAGWCATLALRGQKGPIGAGTGCGPALEAAYPQIASGATTVSPRRILTFRIVDRRVAAMRLADGRRIVPRGDPALPTGWRAAIAFQAAPRGLMGQEAIDVELLGADGRALDVTRAPRGVGSLPTAKVDPRDPPARPCAIEHRALPHLSARGQTIVKGTLTPRGGTLDAAGRPFRTCAAALFSLEGVRLRAAVLVDARHPAGAAPPLPAGYDAAARRIAGGRAWLVVDGGSEEARGRLLEGLTARPPTR